MPLPLIWGAVSVVGFLISWYVYDQQASEIEGYVNAFQELLNRIVISEGMTFPEFLEYGYWIYIVIGFVVLLVFLLIAFPKKKGGA